MNTDYEITIGLEIHAELDTKTKVFCSCKNEFGSDPNTNCCPVCVGMPGALPVLNKHAVELAIMAGLSCGCEINDYAVFERKNYFYPDLSKAYQISQLEKPICVGGKLELSNGKVVRLNRIHLEEDAGKLVHDAFTSNVDYNRGGVPLIETVTEPDISNADEAVEFLNELRNTFVFAGVAKCKMEQGGMRCDVNLSVRKKGDPNLGTRTEMKNLNSFRSVQRAIEFEAERQIDILEAGGKIVQETRRWDDDKGESYGMRDKENSNDYRYFPDPDLLTVKISREDVEKLNSVLPLSPKKRRLKYTDIYGLTDYDAGVLTSSKEVSDFYDECINFLSEPKEISNWIQTEILKLIEGDAIPVSAKNLTTIIRLVLEKKISRTNGKELLAKVCSNGGDAMEIANKAGMLETIKDEDVIKIIDDLIANNPKAVEDYKTTPEKVTQFFIGGVMKATRGKANAEFAKKVIAEKLN